MYFPSAIQKQPQINAAVSGVLSEFSPWVRNIGYDIGQDWTGEWAIFFRVLLSDEAVQKRLQDIATGVVSRTSDLLDIPNLGLFPYFEFRSESEHRTHGNNW